MLCFYNDFGTFSRNWGPTFGLIRRKGTAHRQNLYTQTPDSPHACGRLINIYGYSLYIPYIFHIDFLDMFHVFSLVCFLIYGVKSKENHDFALKKY